MGTTVQGARDTIVLTFNEAMRPADVTFSSNDLTIESGGTVITGDNATYALSTDRKELTITLDETFDGGDASFLITTATIDITPATGKILDLAGNSLADTKVVGTTAIGGDTSKPSVDLTYSLDRSVKENDALTITATFSEKMKLAPTIAITMDSTGDGGTGDLSAIAMTGNTGDSSWGFVFTIPVSEGNDGTAAVTISGTDVAGNTSTSATNNTFEIDNTAPTVALTYSINRSLKGGESLTVTATFSELMAASPTIAISYDSTGDGSSNNISATAMTDSGGGKVWTHTFNVAADAGDSGTAKITISGTDSATNDTFEVDTVAPTVALTYSINRSVKGGESFTVTATFSELMAASPTIAISYDSTGDGSSNNISATAMTDSGGGKVWTHTFNVAADAGDSGTAKVTISGTDSATNANTAASNDTFEVDTVAPTVTLTYSINRSVMGGESLTVTATFSELMAASPTIAISYDSTGDGSSNNISATAMTDSGGGKVWTHTFNVAADAGDSGTAKITISGTDSATNANTAASNDTFEVDNNAPTLGAEDIIGTNFAGTGDTIVPTFSEAVQAADGDFSANEFTIESPNDDDPLNLLGATFALSNGNKTLTIKLLEANAFLNTGDSIAVTPVTNAIKDVAGNLLAADEVVGSTTVADG